MEKQGNLRRIRIAWEVGKHKSYDKWQAPFYREWMQGVIERLNREYGPDTHWIEEEALRRKPKMRKLHCGRWQIWGTHHVRVLELYDPEELYRGWKECLRWRAPTDVWKLYFPDERQ